MITGWSTDDNNVYHGFVRTPGGKPTVFDDPNAGTAAYQGTQAFSINPEGVTIGAYFDANYVPHGFLRDPDGKMATFDATGAVNGRFITMNSAPGGMSGFYMDANYVAHGFLRTHDGKFITFDVPSAGTGPGQGTTPYAINAAGVVTGPYVDANGANHGFVRLPHHDWNGDD